MHTYETRVYYEDTDLSGVVYHANYLKYFERAREHVLGPERLAAMLEEDGVGFVVYELSMNFKRGARLADEIVVRSEVQRESDYRLVFEQSAYRKKDDQLLVSASIDLVCVDESGGLTEIPPGLGLTLDD
jgi:tol-pal system-associated acyl-CoA thioesterase